MPGPFLPAQGDCSHRNWCVPGTRLTTSVTTQTHPLTAADRGGLRPKVYFERFVACIVCLVMDRRPIRQKVVSYSAATAHALKNRWQLLKKVVRMKTTGLTKEEKVRSKRLLKDLRREAKEARRASTDEVFDYIQLVKALKKINRGKLEKHKIFVPGIQIASGRASLENIDMTITGVEVDSCGDGQLSPRIKADLKGMLVVPVPGKPPMRIQMDVKGAEVTLEGRVMPFMNSFIQGSSVRDIVTNIHKVRKTSGEMFKLSKVGLKAAKVSATLEDVQPDTLALLAARSQFSKGRLIERVMAGMAMPMDFNIGEVEVFDGSHTKPMVTMEGLTGNVKCPLEGVTPDGAEETKSLHFGAGTLHVDTAHSSGLGSGILKKLRRASMELMPGEKSQEKDISDLLARHSESTEVDLNDFDLDFSMDFKKEAGKSKPIGSEKLKIEAKEVTVINSGDSELELGVNKAEVEITKTPGRREVDVDLKNYVADIDFAETFPDQHLTLDLHGRITGDEAHVNTITQGQHKETHCRLKGAVVTTEDEISKVKKDKVEVTLPAQAKVSMGDFTVDSVSDGGDNHINIHSEEIQGNGNGDVEVVTGGKSWSLPVDASGDMSHVDLEFSSHPEGSLATPCTRAYCSVGQVKMKEAGVSGINVGDMCANVDDDGNGELVFEGVELDGTEMLKNVSLLPTNYAKWMRPYILNGRKFKFRLVLKIENGKLVREQSEVTGFNIEHSDAASADIYGWGAGYLLGMLQGLVNRLDVSDLTIVDKRLWLELNLKGFKLPLPVPYLTVENDSLDAKGNVSLTGILQEKASIQLMGEKDRHKKLLALIDSDDPNSLRQFHLRVGKLDKGAENWRTEGK